MSARLIAVSGLGPKEPAAFVVEADGRRLLLDCGEGPEPGRLPGPSRTLPRADCIKVAAVDLLIGAEGIHADIAIPQRQCRQ